MCRYVFLSAQIGLVLRLQLDNLLGTSTTTTSNTVAPLYTINSRDLLRGGASLPQWIRMLRSKETSARMHGLCALPTIASQVDSGGKRNVPPPWKQE